MNIIDIIDDPRFFKPLFRDERSWRAWRVFLKALFGIPITDKAEKKLFRTCTGRSRSIDLLADRPKPFFVIGAPR